MTRRRHVLPALGAAWLALGWHLPAAAQAAPAAGRYSGQLCVATTPAGPTCGPAEVELRANGEASVRVADIVYRLQLNSSQVEVVLMQGTMQLDEFIAEYAWAGRSLKFSDVEKNARYEVRLNTRR